MTTKPVPARRDMFCGVRVSYPSGWRSGISRRPLVVLWCQFLSHPFIRNDAAHPAPRTDSACEVSTFQSIHPCSVLFCSVVQQYRTRDQSCNVEARAQRRTQASARGSQLAVAVSSKHRLPNGPPISGPVKSRGFIHIYEKKTTREKTTGPMMDQTLRGNRGRERSSHP